MTHIINKPNERTYYIILNGNTVYGYLDTDQVLTSGKGGTMEEFTVEQDWLDRLEELGIDVNEEA